MNHGSDDLRDLSRPLCLLVPRLHGCSPFPPVVQAFELPPSRLNATSARTRVLWIGILNALYYDRSHIARPAEMSISYLLSEKPAVALRLGKRRPRDMP